MTFEEWLNEPSGFGNFTRGELLADNMPSKLRDFFDDLSTAYNAGYNAGYEVGKEHENNLWEERMYGVADGKV